MSDKEQQLQELYARAEQLLQAGQREKVAPVCEEVLKLDPFSIQPHRFLSVWHSSRGEYDKALEHQKVYNELVPNDPEMMMPMAMSFEETGQYQEALKVLRRVIKLDENNPYPYLYLGSVYEKMGEKDKAGWAYSYAVDMNPSIKGFFRNENLPVVVRERIKRSNEYLKKIGRGLQAKAVAKAKEKFPKGDFSRIEKALWRKLHDHKIGLVNPLQRPLNFYIPDLDRDAWFDTKEFPWGPDFEKEFTSIRNEFLKQYQGDQETLPYLQLGGYDKNSWGDLVGNRDWAAIHLYDSMKRKDKACQRYPYTAKTLEQLPLFKIGGNPVEVLFSILKPHTKIPAHYGTSNARLTVHLPLIVPGDCGLKAGDESRAVQEGKLMFFDDSFLHEAWNNSDKMRAVLIFEVWHPDLREEEKAVVEESYLLYEAWMKGRDYDAMIDV